MDGQRPQPEIEVFYDGDCPLCRREIGMLRRLDRKQRILFTDITAPGFDARAFGASFDDFMAQIRGRLPNGDFITGVEVFRRLYTAVGFGWMVRATRLPGVSWLLDRAYEWFARHRLRLTGRCDANACVPGQKDSRAEAA